MGGAGSARELGGLREDPGGSLDLLGFGKWLLGRHRAVKQRAPKFQLVLILPETLRSGATAAPTVPPRLPQCLPK